MSYKLNSPAGRLRQRMRADKAAAVGAVRGAVNDTLRDVRAAVYVEGGQRFDRATPYVIPAGIAENVGALRTEYAGRDSDAGAVMIRGRGQVPGTAVPHQSILRAQVLGGSRRLKRLEVLLQARGIMPAGWFAIPGSGARLDAYGNMSRGQVVQLLAYFAAFPAGNKRANSTDKSRARLARDRRQRGKLGPFKGVGFVDKPAQRGRAYFTITAAGKGLRPGVYERANFGQLGKGVRPVLLFQPSVKYEPRLDFYGIAEHVARRSMPLHLTRRGSSRATPRAGNSSPG
jgi:hypothetical protein